MKRLRTAPIAAAVVSFAAPAGALADSGSITNVHPIADGRIEASYSATSTTCSDIEFCGWYPTAEQVPAAQPCSPDAGLLTYVGTYQDTSGSQSKTEWFYPVSSGPLRLCLWVNGPSGSPTLVAQYVYTPPAPVPTPVPPTTSSPECGDGLDNDGDGDVDFLEDDECSAVEDDSEAVGEPAISRLTVADAKANLRALLRKDFGSRFTRRRGFNRYCWRFTRAKVRCHVRWKSRSWRYSGNVTLWQDPDDADAIRYTDSVRRKRIHAPAPAAPPDPPESNCDPNYSGCLDPDAYDYDCAGGSGDGPRYTGLVRVLGNDHYDLDRDGDGIACDT